MTEPTDVPTTDVPTTDVPTAEPAKPYRVETTVDAARDAVWPALTEPARIREWFGWDYEGIDGEIKFIFVDSVELDPPGRMNFGNGLFIELVVDGPRTVVRAVMPGPLDGADWDEIYDGMEEGWRTFFEQLRFLLETGPRGRRRTLYLAGTATGADALAVVGDGGRPWHSSRYQRMTVDPAGHLVAVGSQAPLESPDPAPIGITVTTYGLDDAAFAAIRDEWARRWSSVPDATVTTADGETRINAAA